MCYVSCVSWLIHLFHCPLEEHVVLKYVYKFYQQCPFQTQVIKNKVIFVMTNVFLDHKCGDDITNDLKENGGSHKRKI
jgi:hypothetical protein